MNISYAYYKSVLGIIRVSGSINGISSLDFVDKADMSGIPEGILSDCINQLDEYFKGSRFCFSLKLDLKGTEFQKRVWNQLLKIPAGSTVSYGELAASLGNIKACRAVGSAVGKNPAGIIVPCHRVIGSDNSLTGYAYGLWRKEWLLSHEGFNIVKGIVLPAQK